MGILVPPKPAVLRPKSPPPGQGLPRPPKGGSGETRISPQQYECEYCGTIRLNIEDKCESCGARRVK